MAQTIFDSLCGTSMENLSVQTLLDECRSLMSEVEQTAIDQDEEDIFQCGKCKSQFTSLHLFILHKREHLRVQEQTVDLNQYLINGDNRIVQVQNDSEYNPEGDFDHNDALAESIILEENDILFNMDQESANYLTSDASFNVILNADTLESFDVKTSEILDDMNLDNIQDSTDEDAKEQSNESQGSSSINEIKPLVVPSLKYKCNYCEKQFAKKFYWQQHERSHTGEKPYQCVVCGRPFAQKSNVKKHMSSHKVWPGTAIHSLPPEVPIDGSIDHTYHCQFCQKIFDSHKALKAHLIVSHLKLKVYKCVQLSCGKMFAELNDFLEHIRSHKRSEYRCHVCGEVFGTLSDLGTHQYTHSLRKEKTSEKYYSCSVCKSSFSNIEALQNHTETTTHNYVCPQCGKSFLIERFLRRHLKTHTSFARFVCEICGKAFKTEQYLANHRLIHSDETPFSCAHCPARFKRKDRLSRHLLIHDLSKRLKCPFRSHLGCMSEFSRPDKLKRHLLTHSNMKRFNCTHCNRNFRKAQALKHHELKSHNLKCDACAHIFKTKEQFSSHSCGSNQVSTPETSKKHSSSQLPKRLSNLFKPRRPTPKRQSLSKNNNIDKEKKKSKIKTTPKKVRPDLSPKVISADSSGAGTFQQTPISNTNVAQESVKVEPNSSFDLEPKMEVCEDVIGSLNNSP